MLAAILLKRHRVTLYNLGKALQVWTNSFVSTFDVCVNYYS